MTHHHHHHHHHSIYPVAVLGVAAAISLSLCVLLAGGEVLQESQQQPPTLDYSVADTSFHKCCADRNITQLQEWCSFEKIFASLHAEQGSGVAWTDSVMDSAVREEAPAYIGCLGNGKELCGTLIEKTQGRWG